MGKTTVIEILATRRYAIVPEAARIIIAEEKIKGSDILPTGNIKMFQQLVVERQVDLEGKISGQIIFCDRSIIDGYAYCMLANVPAPEQIINLGRDRYEKVFLLSPLDTYKNDDTRIEHSRVAEEIHKKIIEAYKEFGYILIDVPVLPPEERVDYILSKLP